MSRTLRALILVAAAVAIPCGAWFVAADADLERRIAGIEEEPRTVARLTAQRAARSVRRQLDGLLEREAKRPFFHYQALFHDPRGVSQGLALTPSPLSDGPSDPLVRLYFQVDAEGAATLFPKDDVRRAALAPLLAELRPAAAETPSVPAKVDEVQRLPAVAWQQNALAQALKPAPRTLPALASTRDVTVSVGRLLWKTRDGDLFCVRHVTTPLGTFSQGFQVNLPEIQSWMKNTNLPGALVPGPRASADEAVLLLDGSPWHVTIDTSSLAPLIESRTRSLRRLYARTFLAGASVAALVGLLVVLQVRSAEEKALERSRFAASAAHELRTPLTGLRMYADMLAEGLGDPKKTRDYAKRIATETERLSRVVANVLGFSRLERGALTVRPEPADLGAAVTDAAERMRPAVEALGARLVVERDDPSPRALFDRDALDQIVQNLVDNAEKYGRSADDRTIHVSARRLPAGATLVVEDRGPGIAPNRRRSLFTPFARAAGEDAPVGLGLGLAIVRALAQAQQGEVTYEPRPGGGSRFVVTLPPAGPA